MKNSEVRVGAVYRCKVSDRLVPVVVLAETTKHLIGGKSRVAFTVRNEVTGRILTKSAAALRPAPAARVVESGYRPCACRDCMEIAIGEPGAMCHECEDAGCPGERECQASGAYGGEPEAPEGC